MLHFWFRWGGMSKNIRQVTKEIVFENNGNLPQVAHIDIGIFENTVEFRTVAAELFGEPDNRLSVFAQMFAHEFAYV